MNARDLLIASVAAQEQALQYLSISQQNFTHALNAIIEDTPGEYRGETLNATVGLGPLNDRLVRRMRALGLQLVLDRARVPGYLGPSWVTDLQSKIAALLPEGDDVPVLMASGTFNVQELGAVGDGVADDTAAIQDVIDTAIALGSAIVLFPPGVYKVTDEIDLRGASNLILSGYGATMDLVRTSGTKSVFKSNAFSILGSTNPTGDVNGGFAGRTTNIALTLPLSSAAGFATGRYVLARYETGLIQDGIDLKSHTQITRVKGLSGTTLTPDDAIRIPLIAAQSAEVTGVTPGQAIHAITLGANLRIEGFHFTGANATGGIYNAVWLRGYRDSAVVDYAIESFLNGGLTASYCYRSKFRGVRLDRCGDLVGSAHSAASFYAMTGCLFDDVVETGSSFAFSLWGSTSCRLSNIDIESPWLRGFKLYGLAYCRGVNLSAMGGTANGFPVYESYNCLFTNVMCAGNQLVSSNAQMELAGETRNVIINGYLGIAAGENLLGHPDLYIAPHPTPGVMSGNFVNGAKVQEAYIAEAGADGITSPIVFAEENGRATAVGGMATLHRQGGIITTEPLTTPSEDFYTLTLVNNRIHTRSVVTVSLSSGTNTQGYPTVGPIEVSSQQVVISIFNSPANGANPFNGTLEVFVDVKG